MPVWGGVRYVDLYPGVDLVVGTGLAPALDGGRPLGSPLPWRLETRKGADLAAVRLRVEGADAATVGDAGLRLSTAAGDLTLPLLAAERQNVERSNVERANERAFDVTAPFAIAHADRQSQIQNPQSNGLPYATFLGGSDYDNGYGIAVDGAGQAYITGETRSADFPASLGPGYDTSYNGGTCAPTPCPDAFVVKLDAAGTALLYATFLGGSDDDWGTGIAVDGAGQAYVTGTTLSADFPASLGPGYDTSFNGVTAILCPDAFVVKLDAAGTHLIYATFLGGNHNDWGYGIAVDGAGQAYVTGSTQSADFPASLGPGYDTSFNGYWGTDAFVVKLDAAGAHLLYATFLGGRWWEQGYGIAVDAAGQAYVTGGTDSADFPAGPGYDIVFNGGGYGGTYDAFIVKLDAAGTHLLYATFLGGGYSDYGYAIAVDGAGQAYVTGDTTSADFPAGPGYDTSFNGLDDCPDYANCGDAYVVKLDAAGTTLRYATFLGGSNRDGGSGIAVDGAGQAYVTGHTSSADFPASLGPGYDTSFNGGGDWGDAFVVKLDATGTHLLYATFLGGYRSDWGNGIAVDGAGQAHVTGRTDSANFPASLGPGYDTSYNGVGDDFVGAGDAFLVKLDMPPWAGWAQGDRPLLVPPAGAAAVVAYGNQAPPVPFTAHVTGAALFDTGEISGTTSISMTLPDASGSYTMRLIPAIGATAGQTLTVQVEIGPVTLTKDGWIARQVWLPLILR